MTDEQPPDPRATMMWRTGRKVSCHVYAIVGAEPSDEDEPIGTFFTGALAEAAVNGHNHLISRDKGIR